MERLYKNKPYKGKKGNIKKKIIISVVILFIVLFVIPMTITYFTHNYHFGKRIVHQNNYYEYLSTLNPNFTKEIVTFESDEGQILEGAFYSQSDNLNPKGLLVLVHGMGVNNENYLGEIEYLTKENYLVFSFNNTGVDKSEGEDLKGLIQAPIDLSYALNYLYDLEIYNDMPNILIGHSWGGFSVATVSQIGLEREVDGIVTLAGFWQNINVIEDIAHYYVGDIIKPLVPYLTLYEKFVFGENADLNGVDGLNSTNAPVLMMHSKDDIIVNFESNFEYYKEEFESNERFTFIEYSDAGHKLTINYDSYNKIHDIMHHQMELDENDEHYIELEEERLSLITDFNYDVMNNIVNFCDDIVENYD